MKTYLIGAALTITGILTLFPQFYLRLFVEIWPLLKNSEIVSRFTAVGRNIRRVTGLSLSGPCILVS
jgi:hypothetical protein